jgi:hypothetical protein
MPDAELQVDDSLAVHRFQARDGWVALAQTISRRAPSMHRTLALGLGPGAAAGPSTRRARALSTLLAAPVQKGRMLPLKPGHNQVV